MSTLVIESLKYLAANDQGQMLRTNKIYGESINRYFHFLASAKDAKPSGKLWYPAADVYQTPEGWIVKVELAGVSAEDIEIEIQGNILYIAGTRRDRICARRYVVSSDGNHLQPL